MNHTKAMLTDILLHLRKRAERGDPVWRELAAREEAAYCRVRQLCGGDRELLQEVGDLSDACCALRRRVSVFPGPPNGPGVGCVGPAGRGRGGNPLPCPGAFLLVTSTDIRSPSCQRGEMGG
mgnify:CR=1 FL=1